MIEDEDHSIPFYYSVIELLNTNLLRMTPPYESMRTYDWRLVVCTETILSSTVRCMEGTRSKCAMSSYIYGEPGTRTDRIFSSPRWRWRQMSMNTSQFPVYALVTGALSRISVHGHQTQCEIIILLRCLGTSTKYGLSASYCNIEGRIIRTEICVPYLKFKNRSIIRYR